MIDQLIKLVSQNAQDAVVNNKAIPDQQNAAVVQTVGEQIFNGLKDQASQGNLQQLAGMFSGGAQAGALANNPIVKNIISSVASTVASKFGISPQVTADMANKLVPMVMSQFINKTNDPKDSTFELGDVLKNISGNNNLDIGGLLGKFGGSSSENPLGDVGGMLGGFFGKK